MGKNIVVFSDGTGQRGGVMFEENAVIFTSFIERVNVAPIAMWIQYNSVPITTLELVPWQQE